jgi:hypothetical protein
MRINNNKLEIKYALELYKEVPGFPTHRDITYVLIRALEDTNLVGEEFLPEQIWHHMKTCMATMNDLRDFLDQVSSPDKYQADSLLCEKTRQDKKGWHFKLIGNPWM